MRDNRQKKNSKPVGRVVEIDSLFTNERRNSTY